MCGAYRINLSSYQRLLIDPMIVPMVFQYVAAQIDIMGCKVLITLYYMARNANNLPHQNTEPVAQYQYRHLR